MGINVGSVEVTVVPDARGWDRKLSEQLNPQARRAGEQAGQEFSSGIQDRVRKNPPKLPKPEIPKPDTPEMPAPDTRKSDAEIKRFLRDFNAKMKKQYQQSGEDGGGALANGMRLSFMRNSPLIAAGVASGLALGAPAVALGATAMFAGIAVVAEHANADLKASAAAAADSIKSTFADAAQVTVPMFVSALSRVNAAVQTLRPQLESAFASLGAPIDSLTSGVIALVQNAMPGLTAMLRNAGPIFQGLSVALSEIGTGLGKMFQLISEHATEGGQVLQAVGRILGDLLPLVGELVGAGTQLASAILPPVASALHLIGDALHMIAPVLPAVVAGFLALKGIQALSGPLATLSQNLAFASYNGGMLAGTAGKLSTAVSGLSSALPVLGAITVGYTMTVAAANATSDKWAQALEQGGQAAAHAKSQMGDLLGVVNSNLTGWNGFTELIGGQATAIALAGKSAKDAEQKYRDWLTAQNEQRAATQAALPLMDLNKTHLDNIGTAASQASSQISLLSGALAALTGTQVSEMAAQAAVTQAADAATAAVKGQAGALVDNTGAINLNTAAGAAAFQGLQNLATADNNLIGTMEKHGATTADVTAKDAQLRDSFIQTARDMGFSAQQAQNLADQILGIPAQRTTEITADTTQARGQLNALIQDYSQSPINVGVSLKTGRQAAASGGLITGPGGPRSDSIPAMLSNGEFVVNAASTQQFRPLLEAINGGGRPQWVPGFASGGIVDFMRWMQMSTAVSPASLSAVHSQIAALNASPVGGYTGGGMWRALGQQIAAQMGFASQFPSIDYVFTHESGWNNLAQNPTSTAFGIPQFLNSTWAMYGGKTTDPGTQIRDGIRYMVDRYGSPNAAASFWAGHHWYHDGGVVTGPAGANVPAVLKVGETVRTAQQEAALQSGRPAVFHLYDSSDHLIGTMRGVAQQEASGALNAVYDRNAY